MYHLYDVETDDGPVSMIAVLPPDVALEAGLPSPAVAGTVPRGVDKISIENFTPNAEFSDFLNFVISRHGGADPALVRQAAAQGDGWIFMVDLRTGEEEESVENEDIIGAFRAENGRVVADSYRGNPGYRLLTDRGLPQIDAWLQEKLVEELLALG